MTKAHEQLLDKTKCRRTHKWQQVGIWTDNVYKSRPILRCAECGKEKYVIHKEVTT